MYTEEYEIATALLADLFWGPRDNRPLIEDKLEELNISIGRRNERKGIPEEKGKIDIDYFRTVATQLELCCAVTNKLNGNTMLFRSRQEAMKREIRRRHYPEEWNLREDDFLEFASAVARGNITLDTKKEPHHGDESPTPAEETGEEQATQGPKASKHLIPVSQVEEEIEREFGVPIQQGVVEAWCYDADDACSVVVVYEHAGSCIARFENLQETEFNEDVPCIQDLSRAHGESRWTRTQIQGYGLVAWRVEDQYQNDPTAIIRPVDGAYYPETYIAVLWDDDHWTWESRDGLRLLMEGSMKADIILYKMATTFESRYQQKMTGNLPEYPMKLPMVNTYWRNIATSPAQNDGENAIKEGADVEYGMEGEFQKSEMEGGSCSLLRGLEVGTDGLIFDEFNELAGEVVEGDLEYVVGCVVNEYNEILDIDGAVVGHAEVISPTPAQKARHPAPKKVHFLKDEKSSLSLKSRSSIPLKKKSQAKALAPGNPGRLTVQTYPVHNVIFQVHTAEPVFKARDFSSSLISTSEHVILHRSADSIFKSDWSHVTAYPMTACFTPAFMHRAAENVSMAGKGYMIWNCNRPLPGETIKSIQDAVERDKLYGPLLDETKATYNCADDWKKHREEWKKIIMDGSRFEIIITASLPSDRAEPYFWQGPLVGRFVKNRSLSRFRKAQPCPESIAFLKPLDEALTPANGMFKIYPGSENLQTEEELRASGISAETVSIGRNQLLVIGPVWVETRDEGRAVFLWAGYSTNLIGIDDNKALDFIQAAYKGNAVD
ncbi:hypothetical protein TSTA_084420 [Talaromyces stipitatus ATCC 10500]|uniref:Uncharacterized protein n=1 Tax=Talaromyces stipitatus (strain ATCC 10500 / CBS 375.48 / QM 6759 / NRRL 1006) TaxID=441959 RepID=B8M0B4_TALSN|nr:uncharacterized protein TSTA_084420 [Talaromyces stipitatus ATCC 10500]EED21211.1 hypothetical protein TSTA_084420 [Talaromyces stipitatus ATCC 10500]